MPVTNFSESAAVGTSAIGSHDATNAALLAVRILAYSRPDLREKLRQYHAKMAEQIKNESLSRYC
jgi:5-(carboxyamino)imidazole ribonucleotide mutase